MMRNLHKIYKKGSLGYFAERSRQTVGMGDCKCYEDKSKEK
jgi:hypothetical protein